MNGASIKYNQAVLKYGDAQSCVEITVKCSKAKVKGSVVKAVYTIDEWKTVRNKVGRLSSSPKENEHIYRISIPINAVSNVKMWFSVQLCVYSNYPTNTIKTEEVWDNNNGWNYEIITDKLPKICLPNVPSPKPILSSSQLPPPSSSPPISPATKINTNNILVIKLDHKSLNNSINNNKIEEGLPLIQFTNRKYLYPPPQDQQQQDNNEDKEIPHSSSNRYIF